MPSRSKAKLIIIVWVIISIGLGFFGYITGIHTIIPGPASIDALNSNQGEIEAIRAGLLPKDSLLIILTSESDSIESGRFLNAKENLYEALKAMPDYSGKNKLFYKVETQGHTLLDDSLFLSERKHDVLIVAHVSSSIDQSDKELKEIPKVLKKWQSDFTFLSVSYLSNGTADIEMFELIDRDLDRSLIYTLPLTFFVLLIAFRSVAAAFIPLLIALLSLSASLGIAAIYSHVFQAISATSSQLVVLLVLAIGIDYSLFLISRVREEVRRGETYLDAVLKARRSTGMAIFWSGLTVALSLFGLLLMNDTILTSMAVVSILSVVLTVLGSLIFLPALLSILKERIEFGRLPLLKRSGNSSLLTKWLSISVKKPIMMLIFSLLIIIGLSSFAVYLRLGTTVEAGILPKQLESRKAFELLSERFPDLAGIDFSVILSSITQEKIEDNEYTQTVLDFIASLDTVKGPVRIEYSDDGKVARYKYISIGSANDSANQSVVVKLKAKLSSESFAASGLKGYISGTLPYVIENNEQYAVRTPLVFGAVLILCFGFLLLAFRSIAVPLKAIILNVLSTSAAFGTLTLIFQFSGNASWNYGVIESFVPPLLFSILFGLSMDYHVVLLSRIREEVLNGAELKQAIQAGITLTSGAITSAALIMASVFAIISMLELPIMKELGVGLAAAILIDATLIRSVMLPASMVLLGNLNWYFPKWLQWLPEIKLD